MPMSNLCHQLREFLAALVDDPGTHPEPEAGGSELVNRGSIPSDLLSGAVPPGGILWIRGRTADLFARCAEGMLREGTDGELEHLPQKEIQRVVWRFVCEAWLDRDALRKPEQRTKRVAAFVEQIRRERQTWEVVWEIRDLDVDGGVFEVAGVRFFRFEGDAAARWMHPEGHPWRSVDLELVGKTFALATVVAGSDKKAIERGKVAIDDALNAFRVTMARAKFVHDEQLFQRRDLHHFQRPVGALAPAGSGAQREFDPFAYTLSGDLLSRAQERASWLSLAYDPSVPARLRERLARAVHWIGSSVARSGWDDKVVDLCTSLECLLAEKGDKRKAEAIAIRYLLLRIATGDESTPIHPFEMYDLYLLRNDIVHGSAHRICGREDYRALRAAALDALDRAMDLAAGRRDLKSMSALLRWIETESALSTAAGFLSSFPDKDRQSIAETVAVWLEEKRSASSDPARLGPSM